MKYAVSESGAQSAAKSAVAAAHPNGTPITRLHDVAEALGLVAIGSDRYIAAKTAATSSAR